MTGPATAERPGRAVEVPEASGGPEPAPIVGGTRAHPRDAPEEARLDREPRLVGGPGSSPWPHRGDLARGDAATHRPASLSPGGASAEAAGFGAELPGRGFRQGGGAFRFGRSHALTPAERRRRCDAARPGLDGPFRRRWKHRPAHRGARFRTVSADAARVVPAPA